jgi:phytoene dehydrogenase-like protein
VSEHVDVLIIGAGLAGLAAANRLHQAQRSFLLVDSGDRVGGRVRTDVVDGYRIDRGFQVVNPYYPELRRLGIVPALDLRPLSPGVSVSMGRRSHRLGNPLRDPRWALSSITAPVGSPMSKARLVLYALHCATAPARELINQDDSDVESALLQAGVSMGLYESVLKPFLTGVFLDSPSRVSRRYGDLVLRSFVRGAPSLPRLGVEVLPLTIAQRLPQDSIRLSTRVVNLAADAVDTSQGKISADAIILATDPRSATALTGMKTPPVMNSCTTYYHAVHNPPVSDPVIAIDGRHRGPIINSIVLTNASPDYAPPGMHLVATTTLSSRATVDEERRVRAQLALLWGVDTRAWDVVTSVEVPDALPAQRPGRPIARLQRLSERLWVAGDHMDTPSQQGALVSGRRAAEEYLGI